MNFRFILSFVIFFIVGADDYTLHEDDEAAPDPEKHVEMNDLSRRVNAPAAFGGPRMMRISPGRQMPLERIFEDILFPTLLGMNLEDIAANSPDVTFTSTQLDYDPETGELLRVKERTTHGDKIEENIEEMDKETHHIRRKLRHLDGDKKHVIEEEIIEEEDGERFVDQDEYIDNLGADEVGDFDAGFEKAGMHMRHRKSRFDDLSRRDADPFAAILSSMFQPRQGGVRLIPMHLIKPDSEN